MRELVFGRKMNRSQHADLFKRELVKETYSAWMNQLPNSHRSTQHEIKTVLCYSN